MTSPSESQFLDDPEFQSLLVGCLESLERGETIDRDALVKDFPKFAEEIGRFLNDRQLLEQVASDFGDVPPSRVAISAYENTMDSVSGPKDFKQGESIRYIGEYEIIEEIARGGMGVVFKARQQKLGRTVALKMILAGRLAGASDVERFYREARAAGRLQHPHIVTIHEVGEHDGHHYIAMDYINGHGLSEEVRDQTLSPIHAATLVRQVAEAVHFAHQQGTLHRDLKPANILVDAENQTHVTDFGLAKILEDEKGGAGEEELTASGQILGTPGYMSPEQAAARQNLVGPAADVYALGAVLYACLTGRAPFVADSAVDTLLQVIHKEPVWPATLNPNVPKDLETICLKCLEKEPHKRYGTAALLADDLSNFLDGRPVRARPIGRVQRGWRWCRRNPLVASLLSLLGLSLVIGLAVSSSLAILAESRAREEARQRGIAEEASQRSASLQLQAEALAAEATAAQEHSERQVYAMRIGDAFQSLQSNRTRSAWSALDGCRWDLRGWEHDFIHTQLTRGRALRGHTRAVKFVTFADEGRQLISAATDKTLRRWDVAEGRLMTTTTTKLSLSAAAANLSSETIAIGDRSMVELWNGAEMKRVMATASKRKLRADALALSHDGTRLAVATRWPEGKVQWCDTATGEPLWSQATDVGALTTCISPDGKQVAAGLQNGQVLVWSAETGEEQLRLEAGQQAIHALRFDFKGERLVTAGADGLIRVWDIDLGRMLRVMTGHVDDVRTLAISRNDQVLVSGGDDGTVRTWDLATGEPRTLHRGHLGAVLSVDISPDQQLVASGGDDGVVRLWPAQPEPYEVQRDEPVGQIAISSDGGRLAVDGPEGSVEVWERRRHVRLCKFNAHLNTIWSMAFSPDGKRLATVGGYTGKDGIVRLWDAETGNELMTLKGHRVTVKSVAWSTDGRWIASGGGAYRRRPDEDAVRPGEWRIWNATTGDQRLVVSDIDGRVNGIAFSPDGKSVATGGRQVQLWSAETGKQIFANEHRVRPTAENVSVAIAFSPDGAQLASASHHGGLQIWDARSGKSLAVLDGHGRPTTSVLFGPRGRRLFSSSRDRTVRVWDATNGLQLLTLTGHQDEIQSLALSTNGTLLSGSKDGTVRSWVVSRPQQFLPLPGYADGELGVTLDRSRTRLATYGDDAPIMIWDLTTGRQLEQANFQTARNARAVFYDQGLTVAWAQGPWDGVDQLYLQSMTDEQRTVLGEVESKVRSLDLSRDATLLACGLEEGEVQLFNVKTSQRRTLSSKMSPAVKLEFSHDRKLLAVGREDGTVQCWRLTSEIFKSEAEASAAITVIPQATTADDEVTDSNPSTAKSSDLDDQSAVVALCFSPNESRLAIAFSGGVVEVRDIKSGALIFRRELANLLVHHVAFSPSGSRLACSTEQGEIHVLETADGTSLDTLQGHHGPVFAAVYDNDGVLHSVAGDGRQEFRGSLSFYMLDELITRAEYRKWSGMENNGSQP
ncbi:protein kinase domain-containing protein [Aporhodopirellula aestuarii]|uniref:Protein kinase n=1 Tax=Aporhodopirellula aestuarii TaxID=2950107 RepID=A0ABT0U685_9BACT|nr:protein kinase [Aporhodopirellula aestuarii]MCM2372317.1 protein kinase [Aporhodopirellula aestuarii]